MGRHEGIPREVRLAQASGDENALKRMGKAGGEQAARNRAAEKAEREEELEKLRIAIAKIYSLSKDGDDVLPPDDPIVDGIVYH